MVRTNPWILMLVCTAVSWQVLDGPTLLAAPPSKPGVVFVVGGVGGWDPLGPVARRALPRAGVAHEVHEFVWTHGWGHWLKDLQDTRHLLHQAGKLAAEIKQLKAVDPARPIYLIGKSGGTGLVLAAAELLPPATLERIILLSAAVSPTYDLRPALCATRGEIVSFFSRHDKFVLGWGTSQFGTADRVYGPSAGLDGFMEPADASAADRALYRRLVQIPWHPRMIWECYAGGHAGTSFPSFLSHHVAPWLIP